MQLAELARDDDPIDVFDLVTVGRPRFVEGLATGRLRLTTQVPGRAVRSGLRSGSVILLREPISRGPGLVAAGTIRVDVLLLHVSPHDAQGCMSLGVSCDIMPAALARRPVVVVEVNPLMPRTCGATRLRPQDVDFWLESDGAPVEVPPSPGDATDRLIADNILPCDETHGAARLAAVAGLCAINGALEIDLHGRINAEAVDGHIVSGPGGQPDFARGATRARGGKSIIALRATSKDGSTSRILPVLAPDQPRYDRHVLGGLRCLGTRRRPGAGPPRQCPGCRAGRNRGPGVQGRTPSTHTLTECRLAAYTSFHSVR